jgi:hypothetical protein
VVDRLAAAGDRHLAVAATVLRPVGPPGLRPAATVLPRVLRPVAPARAHRLEVGDRLEVLHRAFRPAAGGRPVDLRRARREATDRPAVLRPVVLRPVGPELLVRLPVTIRPGRPPVVGCRLVTFLPVPLLPVATVLPAEHRPAARVPVVTVPPADRRLVLPAGMGPLAAASAGLPVTVLPAVLRPAACPPAVMALRAALLPAVPAGAGRLPAATRERSAPRPLPREGALAGLRWRP